MKTELTVEESAKLIELGVDPKLSSMVAWKSIKNWKGENVSDNKEHLALKPFERLVMGLERFDCKDIFTLTDILAILPKMIGVLHLNIDATTEGFAVGYVEWNDDEKWKAVVSEFKPDGFFAPELIDALYQLLIWYLTEYKTKNNG